MTVSQDDLYKITNEIWGAVFGLEIYPCPTQPDFILANTLRAHIRITGAWNGGIFIQATKTHLTTLASQVFAKPLNEIDESEIKDIIAELANMIGGQVKAMQVDDCNLSLPCVEESTQSDESVENKYKNLLTFSIKCENEPISITYFEMN